MRILWLISLPLPEASQLMGEEVSPFGGWLVNASKYLSNQAGVELAIAFPSHKAEEYPELKGEKITYYPVPWVKDSNTAQIEHNQAFEMLLEQVKPDLVHIYGTETPQTLAMVNRCNELGIESIISIQGLVSVIEKHMYANLPFRAVYGATLRNIIRRDNVSGWRRKFKERGRNEIEALEKTRHIIGRTTWDKANTSQINPEAAYHFCNETLRETFYQQQWDFDQAEKYSIFLSQGQYPLKGLHYALEAMPLILKQFPQAKLYVAGVDITKRDTMADRLFATYYGKYIKQRIHELQLEAQVIFTGPLDEQAMCQRYLKSHVFVSPSSIENSPNSLAEAMILGVPSIASFVGGVADMMTHQEEGYIYQTDAPYMLAYYVCELFANQAEAGRLSVNARKRAHITHHRDTNTQRLLEIYQTVNGRNSDKEGGVK